MEVGNVTRSRILSLCGFAFALFASAIMVFPFPTPSAKQQSPAATPSPPAPAAGVPMATAPVGATPLNAPSQPGALNIVVLDPAHGGTDTGARGTGGIRESDILLDFAAEVRRALELQGFQVVETRQGNNNPSFDDRSSLANAQPGAVFITLHISSTGLPGTVRVFVSSDLPALGDPKGMIPWDRAQVPFLPLSRKFGNLVQGALVQRFKGSPETVATASVRQLRTTAAPAIAVEVSSVIVNDRADLDRMAPGVAEAIARGASAFKPLYALPSLPGAQP